ncbi:MAG: hypothetical protein ABIJ23_00240 [Candidatus Magasanikbacteria bacterium]
MKKIILVIIAILLIAITALVLQSKYSDFPIISCWSDSQCTCDCCGNCHNWVIDKDYEASCLAFCVTGPGPAECKWRLAGSKCALQKK